MGTKLKITESQFDKALYAVLSEQTLLTEAELLTKAQIEQIAQRAAKNEVGQLSKNNLTKNDVEQVSKKAVKTYFDAGRNIELENRVKAVVRQMVKSDKDFENAVVEIAKNVLVQLYKSLWSKRSFWIGDLKNSAG
jgi:hypothetical protein